MKWLVSNMRKKIRVLKAGDRVILSNLSESLTELGKRHESVRSDRGLDFIYKETRRIRNKYTAGGDRVVDGRFGRITAGDIFTVSYVEQDRYLKGSGYVKLEGVRVLISPFMLKSIEESRMLKLI